MTFTGKTLAAAAFVAVCAAGQAGIAPASAVFDEPAYSACTTTTVRTPDQSLDSIATACCVENAGVPTPTTYGIGCVAPVENPAEDYRPTIVMPTWPSAPDEGGDVAFDELMKLPPGPAFPGDGLMPGDAPLP
ncbi:MAG TPA: hypothetical protein VFL67_11690 [Mycobacterium sp.]|nr:hypothetical protein [Mycobacterium sp.]